MFFKGKKQDKKSERIRAHLFVSGRVQGVFFRKKTKEQAEKLNVSGWIRNLKDNRVEAVFEGGRGEVEEIVNWARKGPIWAKVDDFSVVWEDCREEFKGFKIRYDYL